LRAYRVKLRADDCWHGHEGPYIFENERQARDIMEAAFAEHVSSSGIPNEPQTIVHSSSTGAADGAVQEGSGIEDAGEGLGMWYLILVFLLIPRT
jgi:hypothetical protein